MGTPKDRVCEILCRAESELRGLMADAAQRGDYMTLDRGREAAGKVKAVIGSLATAEPTPTNVGGHRKGTQAGSRRQRDAAAKPRSSEYPQFLVRRAVLFKIGWSKRGKKEYLHKIDRGSFDVAIAAMDALVRSGQSPFTADEIVEQTAKMNHAVPIYQVYVAVAFLRHRDVLQKQGREGYSAEPELSKAAAKAWDSLAASVA